MVSTIKDLCTQHKTTIKALERELKLGNGTISRWDDSSPSVEKAYKVASYFGVSVEYLIDPELEKQKPAILKEGGLDDQLIQMLVRVLPEYRSEVVAFVQGLLAKHKE